jgi:hypothetical protein
MVIDVNESIKLAKKYPKADTGSWLCFIPAKLSLQYDEPYKGVEGFWMVCTKEQKGYEQATERLPYFYEEDLMELLDRQPFDRESLVKEILG